MSDVEPLDAVLDYIWGSCARCKQPGTRWSLAFPPSMDLSQWAEVREVRGFVVIFIICDGCETTWPLLILAESLADLAPERLVIGEGLGEVLNYRITTAVFPEWTKKVLIECRLMNEYAL